MLNTTDRCKSRSSMAAAMVVSEKMSPHDATPRLVVRMIGVAPVELPRFGRQLICLFMLL